MKRAVKSHDEQSIKDILTKMMPSVKEAIIEEIADFFAGVPVDDFERLHFFVWAMAADMFDGIQCQDSSNDLYQAALWSVEKIEVLAGGTSDAIKEKDMKHGFKTESTR